MKATNQEVKRRKLAFLIILTTVLLVVTVLTEVEAQEPVFDEFVYLPVVTKPPPGCNFYEPNDLPEQANWIQDGETQAQCIIPKTDSDWVKFSVITESQVIIETSGISGDTELRLYDGDLNQLEFDYDDGVGSFSRIDRVCGSGRDPLAPGLYYARAEEWLNSAEIPNYDITLSIQECPSAVVLMNQSVYTSSSTLYVVGEAQNNGDIGIHEPRIVANLFNDGGQLLDTDVTYIGYYYSWQSALSAGDKSCFLVSFEETADWSYYEFEAPTYYSTGSPLQNVTVYGDNGTYDPNDGSYRIVGFVRNDNATTVDSVRIIATLYNEPGTMASGTVVGCTSQSANNSSLSPGQNSSFEITFWGYIRDYADVESYRIQVDGNLP